MATARVRIAGVEDQERQRVTFAVPATSGDYASERLTIGVVPANVAPTAFAWLSALIESGDVSHPSPTGFVVEVWLPRAAGVDKSADTFTDADYFFSGNVLAPVGVAKAVAGANTVQFGFGVWNLGAWGGAQLRIKSGGSAGSVTLSASAY